MKKIYIIFLFCIITTGCTSNQFIQKKPGNLDSNSLDQKYQCSNDSDCADCCTGDCINYEWWKKNYPQTIAGECVCQKWACACVNNKCINK